MLLEKPINILYSFPHKIGAGRICYTAWQQVSGLYAAGASIEVMPGVLHREFPAGIGVSPTLAWNGIRVSYKLLGRIRACAMHDAIVARRLRKMSGRIDLVHAWPLGAEKTLQAAAELGIPTVIERPNAHTRFAYEVVRAECEALGVKLPANHEHAYNEMILEREETEFSLATKLLCPSEFVVSTFLDRGFRRENLARHIYGYDEKRFYPGPVPRDPQAGLTMLSVGVVAVRKGQHLALDAWLASKASKTGTFLIAGEVLPEYRRILGSRLEHPSVKVLGHREDIPDLMRSSDVLVLPSIEEGFGLVCTEAMGSGCVPLVSSACTDLCRHMENSLVHDVGDVHTLAAHIDMIGQDRGLLARLRERGLRDSPSQTWTAAGVKLLQVYRDIINDYYK